MVHQFERRAELFSLCLVLILSGDHPVSLSAAGLEWARPRSEQLCVELAVVGLRDHFENLYLVLSM